MGGYLLSDSQKHSLNNRVPVKISKEIIDRIKKSTDDYLNNNNYLTIELQGDTLIARVNLTNDEKVLSTAGGNSH